jgi:hypothetical protein
VPSFPLIPGGEHSFTYMGDTDADVPAVYPEASRPIKKVGVKGMQLITLATIVTRSAKKRIFLRPYFADSPPPVIAPTHAPTGINVVATVISSKLLSPQPSVSDTAPLS